MKNIVPILQISQWRFNTLKLLAQSTVNKGLDVNLIVFAPNPLQASAVLLYCHSGKYLTTPHLSSEDKQKLPLLV